MSTLTHAHPHAHPHSHPHTRTHVHTQVAGPCELACFHIGRLFADIISKRLKARPSPALKALQPPFSPCGSQNSSECCLQRHFRGNRLRRRRFAQVEDLSKLCGLFKVVIRSLLMFFKNFDTTLSPLVPRFCTPRRLKKQQRWQQA